MSRKKTNEEFQEELRQLRENGRDIYCDDEYIGAKIKIWFYCSKGHRWMACPSDILHGNKCPYCSGHKVIIGETSLWDTRPDVAELLKDKNEGYKYSAGSGIRVEFVCPICKMVHKKIIQHVCRYGFACKNCSDKISYPEKFSRALLKQLPVICVKYEWSPDWLNPYRFDNYFKYNGKSYVLEMDGGIGHGNKKFGSNEKDFDGYKRDQIKDDLALQHNICVIRVDCDYPVDNRFEYIKNSILNSQLSYIFNLSDINWILCDKQAQNKLVPQVAELYNQGLSLLEIKETLGYSKKAIIRWIKQADNIGLCDYDPHEAKTRGEYAATMRRIQINQYSINNEYIGTYRSMVEAEKQTGISKSNISHACDYLNKSAGGYRWFKSSNPNQPDKTKVINLTLQN